METVNNLTTAASNMASNAVKAVWGGNESHEEPVSGKTGDVSKGEPYDAGNMGEPNETTGVTVGDKTAPSSGLDYSPSAAATSATAATAGSGAPAVTKDREFEHRPKRDSKLDEPMHDESKPAWVPASQDESTSETKRDTTSESQTETPKPKVNPSQVKDSSVGESGHDSTQAQNDTRDPSQPETHPDKMKGRENVDDSTPGPDTSSNPNKIDGPGPRPLEQVAQEHHGDAGAAKKDEAKASADAEGEDDEDGPQKKSHGEGTGEQWVKSTGLKADGGNFDASAPGAGREADRILEEKGVHRTLPGQTAPNTDDAAGGDSKHDGHHKTSLKGKIKAKLHKS